MGDAHFILEREEVVVAGKIYFRTTGLKSKVHVGSYARRAMEPTAFGESVLIFRNVICGKRRTCDPVNQV